MMLFYPLLVQLDLFQKIFPSKVKHKGMIYFDRKMFETGLIVPVICDNVIVPETGSVSISQLG